MFEHETKSTMVESRDRVTRARPLNWRDLGGVIQRIYSRVNVYLEDTISTFLESSRDRPCCRRGGMLSRRHNLRKSVYPRKRDRRFHLISRCICFRVSSRTGEISPRISSNERQALGKQSSCESENFYIFLIRR